MVSLIIYRAVHNKKCKYIKNDVMIVPVVDLLQSIPWQLALQANSLLLQQPCMPGNSSSGAWRSFKTISID